MPKMKTSKTAAKRFRKTHTTIRRAVVEHRAAGIRKLEIRYIGSPTFARRDADVVFLRPEPMQALAESEPASIPVEDLPPPVRPLGAEAEIQPFRLEQRYGSTDVGDVSWVVPTTSVRTATFVPGTPVHSWQAVAAGGMSIGFKGMNVAAQTIARTAVSLYREPSILEEARREFEALRGPDFRYRALLGERTPPLDYRD